MLDLQYLLSQLPAWSLVFFRLTGIFILAPVLGSKTIPRLVKIVLALGLSLCIYPILLTPGTQSATYMNQINHQHLSIWAMAVAVGLDLLVGYIIGFVASLPLVGMQMAGNIISQQMGLAFATIVNPQFGDQSGVVDQVFFMFALAIFVILGGHRIILSILITSFNHVPLTGFHNFHDLVFMAVGVIQSVFQLALRVAAPILCLVFLLTAALGFIERTVPQMNILSVGFAIRILATTALLALFFVSIAHLYINNTRWTFNALRHLLTP